MGAGFTGLTFTLTGDGTSLINQTFATVASAQAFFTNSAMDLGSLASGPLSGATLTLVATFTITTAASGDGFYAQMIIGDPPTASDGQPAVRPLHGGDGRRIRRIAGGGECRPGGERADVGIGETRADRLTSAQRQKTVRRMTASGW